MSTTAQGWFLSPFSYARLVCMLDRQMLWVRDGARYKRLSYTTNYLTPFSIIWRFSLGMLATWRPRDNLSFGSKQHRARARVAFVQSSADKSACLDIFSIPSHEKFQLCIVDG